MAEQKEIRRGKLINARPRRICRADELVSWLYSDAYRPLILKCRYFMVSGSMYEEECVQIVQFCWNGEIGDDTDRTR